MDKLLAEDLRKLDKHELEPKLSALEEMVKEHNSAFISLLEAMTAASAPEEEIEREIDNNSDKEAQHSDYVDRMNRTFRREAPLSKYRSTMAVMDSWLDNATDTAPDFAIKGEAIVKELDQLVTHLDPLSGDALFQPLLDKSKDGLSRVCAHLYKASADAPRTDGAAAPVKSMLSHTTVLQLKPPTFTGKIRDFHGFQECITDMFKNRPDIASDADKVSLLREAMLDPTLKAQVE